MHGVRGCDGTLQALPAWVSEFCLPSYCFDLLARDGFDQVSAKIQGAHDRLLSAHEMRDRARWKKFVDSAFEKGASGAHRFTRLQAAQEIIEAGSEQSPHELADREMRKWLK
eukprot:2914588-Pyramimonas_sp.AAC.1